MATDHTTFTPDRFVDWLQGYVELTGKRPTAQQWACIRDHLQFVFTKVTPDRTPPKRLPRIMPQSEPRYC